MFNAKIHSRVGRVFFNFHGIAQKPLNIMPKVPWVHQVCKTNTVSSNMFFKALRESCYPNILRIEICVMVREVCWNGIPFTKKNTIYNKVNHIRLLIRTMHNQSEYSLKTVIGLIRYQSIIRGQAGNIL